MPCKDKFHAPRSMSGTSRSGNAPQAQEDESGHRKKGRGGILMLLALYFVSTEEGAARLLSGLEVHEFVHDGRHLLGLPCH